MQSMLFVVAHPDDIANGFGGIDWLLKDSYKLHVACATRGERGVAGSGLQETGRIRQVEEAKACALLNAELTFLDKIDQEVYADESTCRRVAELVAQVQPVAIFTMWPIDSHRDHSATAEIAKKAVTLAGLPLDIVYGEEADKQISHFEPDLYVDISGVIESKIQLICCHECQNSGDKMAQAFLRKSIRRGQEAGVAHAEAFRVLACRKPGEADQVRSWPIAALIRKRRDQRLPTPL
jgi:LmbE family N-acetylglucosaminyl deacetylase